MKNWLNTDTKRGSLFFLLAIIGYGVIYYITREKFSFLYGLPGIFLILAGVYWFLGPNQRKLRSGYVIALIGIIGIWILFLLMQLLAR